MKKLFEIPFADRTFELCLAAVKKGGRIISVVPQRHRRELEEVVEAMDEGEM